MNIIDVHTHFFPNDMKLNRSKYCNLDPNFAELYGEKRINIPVEDDLVKILNKYPKIKLIIQSICLLYTSPSPRDLSTSRMPSSA